MHVPRIFIAATKQDEGKTTASLGLLTHLRERFSRIGFIKPVGQHYVELEDGTRIAKDVRLIREAFALDDPPELMSPVIMPRGFTREYIDNRDPDAQVRRICNAFSKLSAGKDFVLIEGTGHAGVGSVLDLSNARVAQILESPVILVTCGGIGKPIDEVLLNLSVFRERGVPVAGVILNKVLPEKLEDVKDYAGRALAWHGLDLVGVVPREPLLSQPTLGELCAKVNGCMISCREGSATLFADVVLVTHFSSTLLQRISEKTLLIAIGGQIDLLVARAEEEREIEMLSRKVSGILLVEGIEPERHTLEVLEQADVPVMLTDMPACAATCRVTNMVAKIQPDNPEKVTAIHRLFSEYVDVDRVLAKAMER